MAELAHKRIVWTGQRASWLEARKLTKDKGGLPSNVLHEDHLFNRGTLIGTQYPAWAREIIVYPEKGGVFKKGVDVVDSNPDRRGRRWVLPASSVPESAIGRRKVGLFIDPADALEENGRVVIVHGSRIILDGIIESLSEVGISCSLVAMPTEPLPGYKFASNEKRWFVRSDGVGVRPLARQCNVSCTEASVVLGNAEPEYTYGVAYAESTTPVAAHPDSEPIFHVQV